MAKHDHNPFPLFDENETFSGLRTVDGCTAIEDTPTEGLSGTDEQVKGYVGLSISDRRIMGVFMVAFVALAMILARAAHVQVVQGAYYTGRAEGNRSRIELIPSERGIIYDRSGIPVVRNLPTFLVSVTPSDLPKDDQLRKGILARLAVILDMHPIEIERRLNEYSTHPSTAVILAEDITHDQAVLLKIEAATWAAISVESGMRRHYLFADETNSLSHILGYQGRISQDELDDHEDGTYIHSDLIGRTGLERSYEGTLRGSYGKRRIEVDVTGKKKTIIAEETEEDGKNIVMSIDLETQHAAETILADHLKRNGKTRASVIIMKPHTGEILAMVNMPNFDNNMFARGITTAEFAEINQDEDNPMFPRAVAASLPSGSTFKLVVGAAALDEEIVTPRTSFLSTGGLTVNERWFFPDWKAGGHGYTDLTKAIAESVNTYFYIVGGGYEERAGLGVERIKEYAERFGFGAALGIDLPVEGAGLIPDIAWKEEYKGERWYVGDTYHLAIGQGDILVTPLQIASMTSVFANGGIRIQPRIVNAVTTNDGVRTVREPVVLDTQVVSDEAVRVVRQGMRQAVTVGSAQSLNALPVAVAGKTGTAQWSSTKDTHAWFTSFAPYDDPEIVVTVAVEEGGEGSSIAAPIARDIYDWYFRRVVRP